METGSIKHVLDFATIRYAISESLGISPDEIHPDSNFVRDLDADSLTLVQLMLDLEDALKVSIPEDDSAKFHTPQDVLNYLT